MRGLVCLGRMVVLLALASVGTMASANDATAQTIVDGQATCEGIGTQTFMLPRPLQTGQYSPDAGNSLWFQFYPDTDRTFFFTNATILMRGVLVSGGGKTVVWSFGDPGTTGWPSLHAAIDPATGEPYSIDGVRFCFNYDLYLNPNAYASIQRRWTWDIEKTGPTTPLSLLPGQSQPASYSVTVTPALSPGVSLVVQGPVFVTNSTPYAATVQQVTVTLQQMTDTDGNGVLDFEVAGVDCGSLPYYLAPFSRLECSFAASPPDASDRLVIADLLHDGLQGIVRSVEPLNFVGATEVDGCVRILDDRWVGGLLGTACATEGAKTYTYALPIGPFQAPGPFVFANTATVIGIDTGTTFDSSTWQVTGIVRSPMPTSAAQCKSGGWQSFGVFKNQGDCVSYVSTRGKNPAGG